MTSATTKKNKMTEFILCIRKISKNVYSYVSSFPFAVPKHPSAWSLPTFLYLVRHLICMNFSSRSWPTCSPPSRSQIWNETGPYINFLFQKDSNHPMAKLAILWPPYYPPLAPLLHFWLPQSTSSSAALLLALTIPSPARQSALSLFENCDGESFPKKKF